MVKFIEASVFVVQGLVGTERTYTMVLWAVRASDHARVALENVTLRFRDLGNTSTSTGTLPL